MIRWFCWWHDDTPVVRQADNPETDATMEFDMLQNVTGVGTLYDFRRLTPYIINIVDEFSFDIKIKKILKVESKRIDRLLEM
ncbi:hypothetical protein HanIR_Chr17g0898001 [Helianthus annuus]|nr:hypothetical protein HanIR_Chr17g0898001 [Helianthus annuus]